MLLNPLIHEASQAYVQSFQPDTINLTTSQSASTNPLIQTVVSKLPLPKLSSGFLCPAGGEGYGPYSRVRPLDLTSCFESLIASVPLGLLLVGATLSIAYLARNDNKRIRGGWSAKILHGKLVSVHRNNMTIGCYHNLLLLTHSDPDLTFRILQALLVLASISAAVHLIAVVLPIIRSPSARTISAPALVTIHTLYALLLLLSTLSLAPLTYFTHTRTRRSSDVILVFWTLFIPLSIPRLRTLILTGALQKGSQGGFGLGWLVWTSSVAHLIFGAASFALDCLGPEFTGFGREGRIRLSEGEADSVGANGKQYEVNENENPALTGRPLPSFISSAYTRLTSHLSLTQPRSANFFSRITFSWLTPLMKLGSQRFIQEDDIFELNPNDQSDKLGQRLAVQWTRSREKVDEKIAKLGPCVDAKKLPRPSLFLSLARAYGGPYATAAFLKL